MVEFNHRASKKVVLYSDAQLELSRSYLGLDN